MCGDSPGNGSCGYKETQRRPRGSRTAQTLKGIPVTMAKGIHLFPSRTQKLSLSAPMVLGWRRPGRVGRCRIQMKAPSESWGFFIWIQRYLTLPGSLQAGKHRTWLARRQAPPVADEACLSGPGGETPSQSRWRSTAPPKGEPRGNLFSLAGARQLPRRGSRERYGDHGLPLPVGEVSRRKP